ncbi:FAD-dependent oxidoreductase [Corallococcus exercitus]|uniref:FAD-dependent oxidoreductase n=1 Tax=Corallococcus exercitus TaxID=2316736 RepID=UPI001ABEE87E|nr:FAD-dependent oxidoreductase [Corallococcus exercitus]
MTVPNLPLMGRVYVLGSLEHRVTVCSQQIRAANLVYALFELERIERQSTVVIIGGGAAGLTAAAAAAMKGARVILLEKEEKLMHMQDGSSGRMIHPFIYDWPSEEYRQTSANLDAPLLRWEAATAGKIAEWMREEFGKYVAQFDIATHLGVRNIELEVALGGGPRTVFWDRGSIKADAVILSVGFGTERQFPPITARSYWHDDRIHQYFANGPKNLLVSGVGDGGLMDTLRATVSGFTPDEAVSGRLSKLFAETKMLEIAKQLRKIEEEASRKRFNAEAPDAFISKEYEALKIPKEFDDELELRLRKDTRVTLNGPTQSPLSLGASVLNRFLVSRLIFKLGAVRYWSGKIAPGGITEDVGKYFVKLDGGDTRQFDVVVIRHGATSALREGFRGIWDACEQPLARSAELDQTRVPIWPPGWFDGKMPGASISAPTERELPPPMAAMEPPIPRTLRPGPFITGEQRLDSTARRAIELLSNGAGIVALTGNVGDGKSEVARQVAHHFPYGIYLQLDAVNPEEPSASIWLEGLARVVRVLWGENPSGREATHRSVREALQEIPGAVIVIDNADIAPPFPLNLGVPCLVVGPGVATAEVRVELPSPTLDEFCNIVRSALVPPRALEPQESDLLRDIGDATGNSALCAKCIAWMYRGGSLVQFLRDWKQDLVNTGPPDADGRIRHAIEKCWHSLGPAERKQVAFIAALGEPEVPTAWLPQPIQGGSVVGRRMLNDSGVSLQGDADRVFRIHRLVAQWARRQSVADDELTSVLISWSQDPTLLDEIKLHGPRAHAIAHAFRLLTARKSLLTLRAEDSAFLQSTFIECAASASEDDGAASLAETFRFVAPSPEHVRALPLLVVGQLIDQPLPRIENEYLEKVRAKGIEALINALENEAVPSKPESNGTHLLLAGLIHAAKYAVKQSASTAQLILGVQRLREIDSACQKMALEGMGSPRLTLLQAKARLQLATARSKEISDIERATLLREQLSRVGELPAYLRLRMIELLLKLHGLPDQVLSVEGRLQVIETGLDLCAHASNPQIQANFLQRAAQQVEVTGTQGVYGRVCDAARAVYARVTKSNHHRWQKSMMPLAFALHRTGSSGTTASNFEAISEALEFYSVMDAKDDFVRTRVAAVVRDLGRVDLTVKITEQLRLGMIRTKRGSQVLFEAFEHAKALRWQGEWKGSIELLNGWLALCEALPTAEKPVNDLAPFAGMVRDELAKAHFKGGNVEQAQELLFRSEQDYRTKGLVFFAERCKRWAQERGQEHDPSTGIFEDEWRCRTRRLSAGPGRTAAVNAQAETVCAKLTQSMDKSPVG